MLSCFCLQAARTRFPPRPGLEKVGGLQDTVVESPADGVVVFPRVSRERQPNHRVQGPDLGAVDVFEVLEKELLHIGPVVGLDGQFHTLVADREGELLLIELVVVARQRVVDLGPVVILIPVELGLAEVAARVNEHQPFMETVVEHVRERRITVNEAELARIVLAQRVFQRLAAIEDVLVIASVDADVLVLGEWHEVFYLLQTVEGLGNVVGIEVGGHRVDLGFQMMKVIQSLDDALDNLFFSP